MSNQPSDFNPYASPTEAAGAVQQPVVSTYQMLKDVKQFRAEIHALGGLWMVFGAIPLVLALVFAIDAVMAGFALDPLLSAGVFAAAGLPFFVCGVGTCCKQLWAVYAGLVLSYLMGVLCLPSCSLLLLMAFATGIFGGHRIISWASELRRKGIPLTTRPQDIQTPLQLPLAPPLSAVDWPANEGPEEPAV